MVRTQVQLEKQQYLELKRWARRRGTSLAEAVRHCVADGLRADRLSTEDIVKTWMFVWKRLSGSPSVTITVKWQNVEIANGTTTIFSGDKVTIK